MHMHVHLFPFIKEQSMLIRVNRIFNSAFQLPITQNLRFTYVLLQSLRVNERTSSGTNA